MHLVFPPDEGFWTVLERDVLSCLRVHGVMAPAQIGERLGMSTAAASSLVAMRAAAGKVRIRSVALMASAEQRAIREHLSEGGRR